MQVNNFFYLNFYYLTDSSKTTFDIKYTEISASY